jgi:hypothetical protein
VASRAGARRYGHDMRLGGFGAVWQRVAAPLALVWLTAVAVIAVVQATTRFPPDHLFASSPAGVAGGRWWPLATSALVIDGAPLAQLTLAAILSVAALRFLGGPLFWLVAAAGHIGATLVAYAGVGVLWLVARGDAESVVEAPDYGISAIWMGLLGALTVRANPSATRRRSRRRSRSARTTGSRAARGRSPPSLRALRLC